jgi:hypothetical protein
MSWDQQFFDPIELPKGKKLVTLRDAANYIMKLPKAEHDAAEWQAAMEALLLLVATAAVAVRQRRTSYPESHAGHRGVAR